MNKKEIAKEFTRQMLDQNTPSINFEQVTNMLKQIEQTHREVLNDMDSFRTKHRTLSYSFTDHHSQQNPAIKCRLLIQRLLFSQFKV